jgi:hypothetical protein
LEAKEKQSSFVPRLLIRWRRSKIVKQVAASAVRQAMPRDVITQDLNTLLSLAHEAARTAELLNEDDDVFGAEPAEASKDETVRMALDLWHRALAGYNRTFAKRVQALEKHVTQIATMLDIVSEQLRGALTGKLLAEAPGRELSGKLDAAIEDVETIHREFMVKRVPDPTDDTVRWNSLTQNISATTLGRAETFGRADADPKFEKPHRETMSEEDYTFLLWYYEKALRRVTDVRSEVLAFTTWAAALVLIGIACGTAACWVLVQQLPQIGWTAHRWPVAAGVGGLLCSLIWLLARLSFYRVAAASAFYLAWIESGFARYKAEAAKAHPWADFV